MNWWKVFQENEKKSKDDEIDSGDENKENDIELSEDEKELDEVDKQIRELQVNKYCIHIFIQNWYFSYLSIYYT